MEDNPPTIKRLLKRRRLICLRWSRVCVCRHERPSILLLPVWTRWVQPTLAQVQQLIRPWGWRIRQAAEQQQGVGWAPRGKRFLNQFTAEDVIGAQPRVRKKTQMMRLNSSCAARTHAQPRTSGII